MRIRLLAFASVADDIGHSESEIEVPETSTLRDLEGILTRLHPKLTRHWPGLAIAIDGELAKPDTSLSEGCEVALLPPVSGGKRSGGEEGIARLVESPIDIDELGRQVGASGSGAVLIFLGTVRDNHEGRSVQGLTYDAYRPMAARALERIISEIEASESGLRLEITHRLGDVAVGEASVVIASSAPHRAAAYRASREALERLKAEVPIWKRENYDDGESTWREEEPLRP